MSIVKKLIYCILTVIICSISINTVEAKPVTGKPIECHSTRNNLNEKQKKILNTYLKTLKKCIKRNKKIKYKEYDEAIIFKGNIKEKDINELIGILDDEYHGICGDGGIYYEKVKKNNYIISIFPKDDIRGLNKSNKYKKIIEKKTKQIVSKCTTEKEASDKIQKWICNHVSYRIKNIDGLETCYAWTAYKKGKALCAGYAQLYKAMCNSVGIKCDLVVGYGDGEGHAWNRVNLDGIWYYSDLTWFDSSEIEEYRYSKNLWDDHEIDKDFYRK